MKNILFIIFEMVFVVLIIYLGAVSFFPWTIYYETMDIFGKNINAGILGIIFISYIIGLLLGIIQTKSITNTKYKNRAEQKSLENEMTNEENEVLKRKIASLEIALKRALENKE